MLKLILSFLSGPITNISKDLKDAYKAKLDAKNDSERLAAEERINLLEARKTVILSAQSDPWERFVRIAFAVPFILYISKILVWDKVLSLGVTDNLSPDFWQLLYIVVGGYFLDTVIRRFK